MPELEVSSQTIMTVGAVTLFILGLAFKIGVDSIKKTINIRLDQRHTEEVALRKENEEDMIHSMEGQQIICDCIHELIYAVLHNEHNGGLEDVSNDLESFRTKNKQMIVKKAARYNLSR